MKADKSYFECNECGYRSSKWYGKCPGCGSFNTMEENAQTVSRGVSASKTVLRTSHSSLIEEQELPDYLRIGSGMGELDRVLGGGLVSGSAVLISGEPGIGKSTLLMQLCGAVGNDETVLYVSGEESGGQLKLRAKRLGVHASKLYVLNETELGNILAEIDDIRPSIVIVDSIQTVYHSELQNTAGSVTQVRECSLRFINKAKAEGFSVILVGHVNKEGGIAGPKVLEHMVDAVLYFEGEKQHAYRIIRAVKNRYGSTNEIGVFEMTESGLCEVPNPSEALLRERPKNVPGSCAVCVMEGTRPLITEIQALVTPTVFAAPRRVSNGVDYNRLCMILAVLEKRLGLHFSQNDVYINVTGGIQLEEPAADLAVALALVSGILDRALPDELVAIGEIGLSGECRSVATVETRLNELARLGFGRVVLPDHNYRRSLERRSDMPKGLTVHPVRGLFAAIRIKDMFAPKAEPEGTEA